MNYQEVLNALSSLRPHPQLLQTVIPRSKAIESPQYIQILSSDNRFLPEVMAHQLNLEPLPRRIDVTSLKLLTLSRNDYQKVLIRLGMCFSYTAAETLLANEHIAARLQSIDSSLPEYLTSSAQQFGEFYEPKASEIISNVIFDEDNFEQDLDSIGFSLLLGYLDCKKCQLHRVFETKTDTEVHVIKSVRAVPGALDDDPTPDIINRIINQIS